MLINYRRFTADQYEAMGRTGILSKDDRVELLDGGIYNMSPVNDQYDAAVRRTMRPLAKLGGPGTYVSLGMPVRLDDYNELTPDVVLYRSKKDPDEGRDDPLGIGEVLVLVEIGNPTVHYDRDVKLPLYARAGIPEVWLVDLQTNSMSIWQDPHEGEYRVVRMVRSGDELTPALLPDVTLKVADLLG